MLQHWRARYLPSRPCRTRTAIRLIRSNTEQVDKMLLTMCQQKNKVSRVSAETRSSIEIPGQNGGISSSSQSALSEQWTIRTSLQSSCWTATSIDSKTLSSWTWMVAMRMSSFIQKQIERVQPQNSISLCNNSLIKYHSRPKLLWVASSWK